jgi:ankyrin repeat protein
MALGLALAVSVLACGAAFGSAYDDVLSAVRRGDTPTVLTQLKRGVDVNSVDANGNPLIAIAAENGFAPTVDALGRAGARIDLRNRYGETALMLASIRGHAQVARLLIDRGAELNPAGWTPLMYAASRGQTDVARLLISFGAKVDATSENGTTALMLATRESTLAMVKLLHQAGANVRMRNANGQNALDWALDVGKPDIAEFLISVGAKD